MLGRQLQLIISWEMGRGGIPKALCPQDRAGAVERGVCAYMTTQIPKILKFAHALGSERVGRESKELPVVCDQLAGFTD